MTQETHKKQTVGILAYGSLISNPGEEIEKARTEIIKNVMTPFPVEYARSSSGRGGAPTLVPVSSGGAKVRGQVFAMDFSEEEAANILYRREIGKVGEFAKTYKRPEEVKNSTVLVERLTNFAGLDVVLYTKIAATIQPLSAAHLVRLAIKSVSRAKPGLDGITYLRAAKESGIETALSPAYEAGILEETESVSLNEAYRKVVTDNS
ncbi:hypothetical protein [Salipiger thiooxidans]|uniref:hypothetical protein n=1 Tax=Salipiger thiooxidans TaxID=282683 RepID=UPI001CD28933|nr:hypothetical protein [Salipiger thiooxidans]MCA0848099.1 hypothetical protein [Salipiger thiooxidans]